LFTHNLRQPSVTNEVHKAVYTYVSHGIIVYSQYSVYSHKA